MVSERDVIDDTFERAFCNIYNYRSLYSYNISIFYYSGVHHKKTQCDTEKVVKKVQTILEKANSFLYPKNLVVTTLQPKKNAKLPKGKSIYHSYFRN